MSSRRSSRIRYSAFLIAIAATALYFSTAYAAGGLVIDEIMYDTPGTNSGHQWIEIVNSGSGTVDLSAKDLRFFDKSGSHVIAPYGSTESVLPPGSVAIIADKPAVFLADHPNFSGALFDSVVSLTANETIGFKTTEGTVLASVSYTSALGAKGDGNSLHASGAAFTSGSPNPGVSGTLILKPPIAPVPKLSTASESTNKSTANAPAATNTSLHSSTYDKGISAPTAKTPSSAVGAAVAASRPGSFFQYLFSSIWFALFLVLLVFSGTSLILIRKHV